MAVKKENDSIKKYDWAIFASSYFLIAKLACQELLSNRSGKYSQSEESGALYKPRDLYVSILFNIKHGVEVFIKALGVFAYGEYEDNSHDIKTLFDDVKKRILKEFQGQKLKPRQKGFYDDVSQADINTSFEDLEHIEKLILYFFELEFLKQKFGGNFSVRDIHNDVLRYPDNKAVVRIDWGTILYSRVSNIDIEEIFLQLNNLYGLFNKTGRLLAIITR